MGAPYTREGPEGPLQGGDSDPLRIKKSSRTQYTHDKINGRLRCASQDHKKA